METALKRFLGVKRWRELHQILLARSAVQLEPPLGLRPQLAALLIAITPVAMTFLDDLRPHGTPASALPTVAFGICALLAMLCRSRLGLTPNTSLSWRKALSVTHTAVALGCVPAAAVLLLSHTLLADRHDILSNTVAAGPTSGPPLPHLMRWAMLAAIAAWVALTEEVIFRGMLVGIIRRTTLLRSQRARDTAAVCISALLFGVAHWPTWGALPAIALTGLGIGFVLGFIANGERLGPIVLYHFGFDLLSLCIST